MMVVKASLALGLQESIGNFWQGDDDFSDCIVMVENTSFKCHRFILSACSSFFHRLFRSQMKESLEGVVHIQEMSKTTFETILNSIYKGVDGLTEDNILDVWSATEFLQIDYLINECKSFAGMNISLDNCCRFINHAVMYSAQNVIDDCLDLIAKNFERVKNEDSFLQMTFDCFYQVIGSDYLVADCEDSVVETILKWVNYKPGLERSQWLFCGTLENKAASERQSQANILQHDLPLSNSQENYSDGQKNENDCSEKQLENLKIGNEKQEKGNNEQTDLRNNENSSLLECVEDNVENESNTAMSVFVDGKTIYNKSDNTQVFYIEGDRKQHFSTLLSACRYLLVKPSCLENLLNNHTQLLEETGTNKLVVNALMYTTCVDRRYDCWPESAIYRTSSPNKHVMVWLSRNKILAFSLDTIKMHEVTLQEVEDDIKGETVFGNAFYLLMRTKCMWDIMKWKQRLDMLTSPKQWVTMNKQEMYVSDWLLAHGNIYVLYNGNLLYRCTCIHGQNMQWSQVCTLEMIANCLVRFHKYIVIFSTQNTTVTAYYYNPENHQVLQSPGTLEGSSEDMESFTHGGDVYILQPNGTLWKLFSTDTTPVDFELVSKLWECDCSLRGCILYKNALFIFCDYSKMISNVLVTSLPGLFENIKIVKVGDPLTRFLPMVLHESCLTL